MSPTTAGSGSNLIGSALCDGWEIVAELPRPGSVGASELTGGFFSIGCIAHRPTQSGVEKAFVKVIDVARAAHLYPNDFMKGMQLITSAYSNECSILSVCESARLDRIVRVLGKGQLPLAVGSLYPLPYIIFEHADGDLRKLVSASAIFEDAWKLRVLHDVAVGLQQLHQQKIAHQDLKPSNVLVFNNDGEGAKIGDLGRASLQGQIAPHDGPNIAGACAYAPPEQAYGIHATRWEDQREGCDIYHLGSLTCFLLSGRLPNDHFRRHIDRNILPVVWGGLGKSEFNLVLPFLREALTSFVVEIAPDFPLWGRDELSQIVMNTCNPDYEKRGDPGMRSRTGSPLGLDTFVSRFDRLARRALVKTR
jgi:eukaryotic-like serine/threonine-protein kinase